jgi:hypothetical protein
MVMYSDVGTIYIARIESPSGTDVEPFDQMKARWSVYPGPEATLTCPEDPFFDIPDCFVRPIELAELEAENIIHS